MGSPPSLINVPSGCAFNPRCAFADLNDGLSTTERPELVESAAGHLVACHLPVPKRREIWRDEIQPKI
jgi:peptide/nickel transport system ATP-binding protein